MALCVRRMQIEENFRDTKSLAFGMETEIGRSRSALRLQALLLIAKLAAYRKHPATPLRFPDRMC